MYFSIKFLLTKKVDVGILWSQGSANKTIIDQTKDDNLFIEYPSYTYRLLKTLTRSCHHHVSLTFGHWDLTIAARLLWWLGYKISPWIQKKGRASLSKYQTRPPKAGFPTFYYEILYHTHIKHLSLAFGYIWVIRDTSFIKSKIINVFQISLTNSSIKFVYILLLNVSSLAMYWHLKYKYCKLNSHIYTCVGYDWCTI